MAAEGREFKGIIFFGLMLTEKGPKVLEYNARFGDPEAQVVIPRLKNDIVEVFEACVDGKLDEVDLQFEDNAAVCVVLASDGYPVSYEKGFPIEGLDTFKDKDGYYVFHAGTAFKDGKIVTNLMKKDSQSKVLIHSKTKTDTMCSMQELRLKMARLSQTEAVFLVLPQKGQI